MIVKRFLILLILLFLVTSAKAPERKVIETKKEIKRFTIYPSDYNEKRMERLINEF